MNTPLLDDAERVSGELVDVFLLLALAADRRIDPRRWVLAGCTTAARQAFDSYEDALTWVDFAAPVTRGCVRIVYETARHEVARQLTGALSGWLRVREDFRLWKVSREVAEVSVRGCGPGARSTVGSVSGARQRGREPSRGTRPVKLSIHTRNRGLFVSHVRRKPFTAFTKNLPPPTMSCNETPPKKFSKTTPP